MKHRLFHLTILAMLFHTGIYAQYVLKDASDVDWYSGLPQENVSVFTNSNSVLAGEYLYYSINCLNQTTKAYSKNSKMAYVELLGAEGLVFKHKVPLKSGKGQGDALIPVDVETGNYKLIAYTQWMKNAGVESYYVQDIQIVNPYKRVDFVEDAQQVTLTLPKELEAPTVALSMDKTTFGTREKVVFNVASKLGTAGYGTYAISVKQLDPLTSSASSVHEAVLPVVKSELRTINQEIYLPEFSGELITGRILDKATQQPAKGVTVALSMLGDTSHQDVVYTSANGIFYFQIKRTYKAENALIQVVQPDRENYLVQFNAHDANMPSDFQFKTLEIPENMRASLQERSIHNQIENAYVDVKKDTYLQLKYPKAFYGNQPSNRYRLDDYTRFPTIAETMTEVVDNAWFKKGKDKTLIFDVRAREFDPYAKDDIKPLVVVDGAYIYDHEAVLNASANDVETIAVYREEYYYGDNVYQGVVEIKTQNGDYADRLTGDYIGKMPLFRPEERKRYYKSVYTEGSDNERIPDYRHQLLWVPEFRLNTQNFDINFYTSDVKGVYEIRLMGFNSQGGLVEISKQFKVE